MNRLVIIGNGFDLSHGLKTSYIDFFSQYLKNIASNLQLGYPYRDAISEFSLNKDFPFERDNILKAQNLEDIKNMLSRSGHRYIERNTFFTKFYNKNTLVNWVDIEQDYFKNLVLCTRNIDKHNFDFQNLVNFNNLNYFFEEFKKLFEEYLMQKVLPDIEKSSVKDVFTKFIYNPINHGNLINYPNKRGLEFPQTTMLLNFNYTPTILKYTNRKTTKKSDTTIIVNNIHGELNSSQNPIIFGCGDTFNNDYNYMEDLDLNQLFKHVKLFKYMNTPGNRKLEQFIRNDIYEVIIIGHSCGLSDKVLLKRIFEDKNCISIVPCFYKDSDFNDRVMNISRHFESKVDMMRKIVEKNVDYFFE